MRRNNETAGSGLFGITDPKEPQYVMLRIKPANTSIFRRILYPEDGLVQNHGHGVGGYRTQQVWLISRFHTSTAHAH
jgi:hypothetical protein